jgi:O-antigen/teichoic acid export membrane protein
MTGSSTAGPSTTPTIPRRGLEHSSFSAFVVNGAAVGATYVAQLSIARVVGATSYGYYSYVLAFVTILAYLAALGFDVSLIRLVASYKVRGAWGLMKGVVGYAESRVIGCGSILALLGTLIVAALSDIRPTELRITFLLGFAVVPMWALLWVRAATVRALGGVISALLPDRLVRDGMLIVLVWLASVLWHGRVDAALVMGATLASAAAGLGLVTVMKRHWRPATLNRSLPESAVPMWRRAALPLVLIAVAESAMNRAGVVLLGWEGQAVQAGVFALIFNVTSIVVLPRIAVNTRFAPMVSELFTRGDMAGLQALTTRATGLSLAGGALIALSLALFGNPVLSLFGQQFGQAVMPMHILLLGQMVAAGAGSQIFLMTMTGHEAAAAVVMVSGAVLNIFLSATLVHWHGIVGAAVAALATLVALNLWMAVYLRRRLGLVPGVVAITSGSRIAV